MIRRFLLEREQHKKGSLSRSPTPPLVDNYIFQSVPGEVNTKNYLRGRKIEAERKE